MHCPNFMVPVSNEKHNCPHMLQASGAVGIDGAVAAAPANGVLCWAARCAQLCRTSAAGGRRRVAASILTRAASISSAKSRASWGQTTLLAHNNDGFGTIPPLQDGGRHPQG